MSIRVPCDTKNQQSVRTRQGVLPLKVMFQLRSGMGKASTPEESEAVPKPFWDHSIVLLQKQPLQVLSNFRNPSQGAVEAFVLLPSVCNRSGCRGSRARRRSGSGHL